MTGVTGHGWRVVRGKDRQGEDRQGLERTVKADTDWKGPVSSGLVRSGLAGKAGADWTGQERLVAT